MRPPKDKWRLTARAVFQVFRALEAVEAGLPDKAKRMVYARRAVRKLAEHVESSEECES